MKRFIPHIFPAAVLYCALLPLCGCAPGLILPGKTDVYRQKPLTGFAENATVLIVPFEFFRPGTQLPGRIAARFQDEIMRTGCFNAVDLVEDDPWFEQLAQPAERIRHAIAVARRRGHDLVLIGTVVDYMPHLGDTTRLSLDVRLLAASSGEVLWWARHALRGIPGRTFLLWDHVRSPAAPSAERLEVRAVAALVEEMLPECPHVAPSPKPAVAKEPGLQPVPSPMKSQNPSPETALPGAAHPPGTDTVQQALQELTATPLEPNPDQTLPRDRPDAIDAARNELDRPAPPAVQ